MSRKLQSFFGTLKQKVAQINCYENVKIKLSREFKLASCWKGRKTRLEMHLMEQNSSNVLEELKKYPKSKQTKRWKVQERP